MTALQQDMLFSLPLFATLSADEKDAFAAEKPYTVYHVNAGEVLSTLPNYQDSLAVILEGSAIVQNKKGDSACIRILPVGAIFGVASLFSDEVACDVVISTVTAKTPCKVVFIEKSWVELRIKANSDFALAYIRFLSNRICFLNQRITAFTAPSATERLKNHLTSLCEGNYPKEITVNAVQLASMLNVSRISLYRAFDALEEKGIIQKNGKTITILKD